MHLGKKIDISKRKLLGVNELRPGITGLAQINGRDNLSIDEKVKYDYEYYKNNNFFIDLIIILKTIIKVVKSADIKH